MKTKREVIELLESANLTEKELEELYQILIEAKPELLND